MNDTKFIIPIGSFSLEDILRLIYFDRTTIHVSPESEKLLALLRKHSSKISGIAYAEGFAYGDNRHICLQFNAEISDFSSEEQELLSSFEEY